MEFPRTRNIDLMYPFLLRIFLSILDSRCPPCGSPRLDFSLCPNCRNLPRLTYPFCLFCEFPLGGDSGCSCGRGVVFSSFCFDSSARTLLHMIKYQGKDAYLSLLTPLLPDSFPISMKEVPTLIPVPLSHDRFCERTFNQSEWLSRQLSKKTGLPVNVTGLIKTRETKSQSSLSRNERKINLENAFHWNPQNLVPETVCIVDDVYTTGETIRACTQALKKAGAKTICAWTLFRKLL